MDNIKNEYEKICDKVNTLNGIKAKVITHNNEIFIGFFDDKKRSAYSEMVKNE